jgi:hypothetical protein
MARSLQGRAIRTIGSTSFPVTVGGTANHNFEQINYKTTVTGAYDVRGKYEDLEFASTCGGEMLRIRAIASGTGVAAGGTINAIHATGQVKSCGTVSGSLHAIRATLEVAGTIPTPGGRLSALMVDSIIASGATLSANDSFIQVNDAGTDPLTNLFDFTMAEGTKSASTLISTYNTATQVGTHGIKCRHAGADLWILATATAPTT